MSCFLALFLVTVRLSSPRISPNDKTVWNPSVSVSVNKHTEIILGSKIFLPSIISGKSCFSLRMISVCLLTETETDGFALLLTITYLI